MIRKFVMFSTLLLCTAGVASAESFTFNYTGIIGSPSNTVSGILTTTEQSAGVYLITGITDGLFDGTAITSVLGTGSFVSDGNDNLLYYPAEATGIYTTPAYIDYNGISFTTADGEFNLYFNGSSYALASTLNADDIYGTFALSPDVSATPEPSSLFLLGTGLLGACFMFRRKVAL